MTLRAPNHRVLAATAVVACAISLTSAATAHSAEIHVHGLADFAYAAGGEAIRDNWLNQSDSSFDPYRVRLFFDGDAGSGVEVFLQLMFAEVNNPRVYGAYARWTPKPELDLHLMAGVVPWTIGTFAPRTYSDENPLMGTPLMYFYHSSLRSDAVPATRDALLAARGTGQVGPNYGTGVGSKGMPFVYDRCWDYGVVVQGSRRPFEYSIGVQQGTPSTQSLDTDTNDGKSVVGRLGLAPIPELRVGVSGAYGSYLANAIEPSLAPGTDVDDFNQVLTMADLEFMSGPLELRAEGFQNRFETPTIGNLDATGGYGEARITVRAGLHAAVRYDVLRFDEIQGSSGPALPWDCDRERLEVGLGWRPAVQLMLKGVYQRNTWSTVNGDRDNDLIGTQLSIRF
ncbi:MAG: hypothetical protein HOP12_01310 [Candidatus Eisenbacteria bacterium]|uniref:Porin n=1 Tax=Eiseniibacteriota bacterium TaxID=2212470 RepID=A0A849SLK9_UNCEI|nr:hypothetical protein [Candidatus Eisenbacteria bacterium]